MAESFPSTIAANILTEIDFLTSSDNGLSSRILKEIMKAKEILFKGKAILMKAEVGKLNIVEYYLKIKVTRKRLDEKMDNIQSISIAVKDPDTKLVFSGENVMNHPFVGTPQVFGRDTDEENIIKLLMKPNKEAERVSVIPIVGFGGIGKTTLAKLVYDDKRIDEHF
ncbi:disease resistance protein RGA2-like [Pistacia vera]|uniref:disease resistance protein RGA2-like n=1 Tax=Pistacia vera TaxID=55513 RepID=UPI001262F9EC|nr:disease resistance protein RGA2-like [Pistacia vera]